MFENNFLSRFIEQALGQYWQLSFRLEVLAFLVLAVFLLPKIRADLREASRSAAFALAGLMLLYAALLWLRAGPDFAGFSEEWEELNLAKMVLNGDMASFKVQFRHGTTWPFLLADWFRLAGARPEMAQALNLIQSLAIPLLLFAAARLLFRSDGAAILSVVLFIAWPETARYTALTYGKTAFVMFAVAVFTAAAAVAFRFPGRASFALVFLAADLAAKTRQEFAVLYLAAALLWLWKAPRKTWWLPLLMLPLIALYYQLFARGVACHFMVSPSSGETLLPGAGEAFPWLLSAACALIAAAVFRNKKIPADKAWRLPALVFLLPNIVYFVQPGIFQNRLSAQTLPALLVLLGWAIRELAAPRGRTWLCAGILPLLLFSWTAEASLSSGDAEAALARFRSLKAGAADTVVFADLNSYSQWSFFGFDQSSFQLSAISRGWDDNGRHSRLRPGRLLGGRTVWFISRPGAQNKELREWAELASEYARKTGDHIAGDWLMRSYVFSGEKIDPWLSKTVSDKGVEMYLRGDFGKAAGTFKKALELDPENQDALISYAAVRKLAGDVPGCEKLMKRLSLIANDRVVVPVVCRE